jgi:hypothetical protein
MVRWSAALCGTQRDCERLGKGGWSPGPPAQRPKAVLSPAAATGRGRAFGRPRWGLQRSGGGAPGAEQTQARETRLPGGV